MPYRRLGRSGLKVSLLSFGSWVSFGNQVDDDLAVRCLEAAREGGVNFFDNAESYAGGQSEEIMGRAIKTLGWQRHEFVVSSKFFWGIHKVPNMTYTLNRKYLMQAVDASLERFGLDFLDLIFCHRADPETPIEETVWAMSDIVSSGKALYWGTSEWAADEIVAAIEIAERHHLYKPVMEQPQYNLLAAKAGRDRVRPVARGLRDRPDDIQPPRRRTAHGQVPRRGPGGLPRRARRLRMAPPELRGPPQERKVRALKAIADDLGCPLAQLAIAWCASQPQGLNGHHWARARRAATGEPASLEVLERLDDEVMRRINEVAGLE